MSNYFDSLFSTNVAYTRPRLIKNVLLFDLHTHIKPEWTVLLPGNGHCHANGLAVDVLAVAMLCDYPSFVVTVLRIRTANAKKTRIDSAVSYHGNRFHANSSQAK